MTVKEIYKKHKDIEFMMLDTLGAADFADEIVETHGDMEAESYDIQNFPGWGKVICITIKK